MWSNVLDSDTVKGFVSLATALVKVLDALNPLNVAFVSLFTFLAKKHDLFSGLFKPAEEGIDTLRKQLAKAEKDLAKANTLDIKHGTNKTAETRRNAEERVNRLKEKVQPYDDVDKLKRQQEELLEKQHNLKLGAIYNPSSDVLADQYNDSVRRQIEAANKKKTIQTEIYKTALGNSDVPSNTLYADLQSVEQELTDIRVEQEKLLQNYEQAKGRENELKQVNDKLDQTNKELAEAEARLAKIDKDFKPSTIVDTVDDIADTFDPKKAKNSIVGKKSARTKRANRLQAEGKSFAEIESDPKIKQYTKEIEEAEKAIDEYNARVAQADDTLKQKNITTAQAVSTENVKAGAEAADAVATNAGTTADIAADVATKKKTASTWADILAEITRKGATGASVAATLKQVLATKLATSELVKKGAAEKGVMVADLATLGVTKLLTLGFYGLVASIKATIASMWTLMTTTPLGPILLVVAAVASAIAIFSHFHKTTEELKEELDGFKSELSDIRSELDEVNSELEATNERMNELLAKDKLTFEEQEELDRLRETNDELERRKELLESEEEYKSGLVGRQAAKVVDSVKSKKDWWDVVLNALPVVHGIAALHGGFNDEGEEAENNIEDYKKLKEKYNNASSLTEQDNYQKQLDAKAAEIDEYILELSEALEGVEYGDSKESDAALDYLAELQDNYAIARGSAGAKTNAIKGIMKKEEFSSMSNAIDYYVEALKNGETGAADAIAEIINNNEDFVADLEARGLEAKDAIDLYTKLGEDMNFNTLEGKTEEIKRATEKLPEAFNNIGQFMDGDTVNSAAVAEYFKGTSNETREEIAKLIQDINDGNTNVETALKQFELFGVQSVLEIEITEVQTNFKDTFTDLEGADGLINTFQELADAIGSTSKAMDALNAAQAEMKANGRVSIETALKLMEYTDDYSKVLTISEGKLILAEDAEENLIEARLDGMKASALKALEDAKAARETTVLAKSNAEIALSTYNSAIETEMAAAVTATAWDKVLAAAAGLWAGIKSLFTSESWTEAYDRAYQETLNSISGDRVAAVKAKYESAEEQAKKGQLEQDIEDADKAIEEQDKEIARLQGNYDLVSGLNKDNIDDVFKSDDFDTVEDAIKDGWEKLINKYENELALITNERDLIEAEIDKMEAQGGKASSQYYKDLIRNSNEEKELLVAKKQELEEYLELNKDNIDSETWTEYNNTINETAVAIKECDTNTIEWAEALREIDMHYFEQATDEVSRLGEELDFVNSLLEDEDVADENGNWTDAGITRLGLYTQQMEKAAAEAKMYQDEIDELNTQYQNGELSEEQYQERLSELVSGQQDAIQSYEDAKDGIVELNEARIDAIKEGIEKEIEAYEDYIDVVKDALDAERDLYDFKKNVQKQSKDIASLERRIASLSGSTNASDIATRRKLEAELLEAREGLNDTYYEHSQDQQNKALDEEAEAFSESKEKYIEELESTLKDVETLITNSIMDVMLNADTVLAKLNEISTTYGYDLSTALKQPWVDASSQAIAWKNELQNSMTSGEYAALIGEGGAITAFANGVATKLGGSWTSVQNKVKGYADFLTGTELGNRFSNAIISFANQIQLIIDKWNGVKKAADDAYVAQTRTNNVGGNSNNNSNNSSNDGNKEEKITTYGITATVTTNGKFFSASASSKTKSDAEEKARQSLQSKVVSYWVNTSMSPDEATSKWNSNWSKQVRLAMTTYAKGTLGTKQSGLAITDESWIGEEITLAAGKNGQLQYLKKGSAVMPADISANLVEWGKLNPDMLKVGCGANLNMISNAVNKPEINFEFDSLVHVDNCSQETLKDLEKMVDNKINQFSKQMNYAIKRIGGR